MMTPARDRDESADPFAWLAEQLDELARADLLRRPVELLSAQGPTIELRPPGETHVRRCVNLCSNNYLNLAADPRIARAAADAIANWGFGSGASRLVTGTTSLHRQAERTIADWLAVDEALLLASGYQANVAAVTALAGPGDVVILDKLNHASLIDAARQCGARLRVYPHVDVARLAELLARSREARRTFVLTDSLFSMDGDFAPLRQIVALKQEYEFVLVVDEAHALGVFGDDGRGVCDLLKVADRIDVRVGTCSKSLGGAGGFIAGRQVLIDALRNVARPFIFSTAPPAAVAAATIAAVEVVRGEPDRRARLLALSQRLRDLLRQAGFDTGASCSQIVPILWGSAGRALAAQQVLLEAGLFASAIRPPTVPRGSSRLRISLMCDHREGDLEAVVAALVEARVKLDQPGGG